MTEYRGKLRAVGSVGIVVSAYHERITSRLLEGALATCANAGLGPDQLDVVWVPGAFELGVTAAALARSGVMPRWWPSGWSFGVRPRILTSSPGRPAER